MTKLSDLILATTVHSDDLLLLVDVHDATMAASGTDKALAVSTLVTAIAASLPASGVPYTGATADVDLGSHVFYSSALGIVLTVTTSIDPSMLVGGWHLDADATDYSGNGNTATWTGSAAYVAGPISGHDAAHLATPGSDYLSGSDSALPSGDADRSIFAWVYPTSISSSYWNEIFRYGTNDTHQGLMFVITPSSAGTIQLESYYGSTGVSSPGVLANQWNHVGFSYSAGMVTFYINGAAAGTAAVNADGSLNTVLSSFNIGLGWVGQGFHGDIAEVQVFNTALSAGSAALLYAGGAGYFGVPTSTGSTTVPETKIDFSDGITLYDKLTVAGGATINGDATFNKSGYTVSVTPSKVGTTDPVLTDASYWKICGDGSATFSGGAFSVDSYGNITSYGTLYCNGDLTCQDTYGSYGLVLWDTSLGQYVRYQSVGGALVGTAI